MGKLNVELWVEGAIKTIYNTTVKIDDIAKQPIGYLYSLWDFAPPALDGLMGIGSNLIKLNKALPYWFENAIGLTVSPGGYDASALGLLPKSDTTLISVLQSKDALGDYVLTPVFINKSSLTFFEGTSAKITGDFNFAAGGVADLGFYVGITGVMGSLDYSYPSIVYMTKSLIIQKAVEYRHNYTDLKYDVIPDAAATGDGEVITFGIRGRFNNPVTGYLVIANPLTDDFTAYALTAENGELNGVFDAEELNGVIVIAVYFTDTWKQGVAAITRDGTVLWAYEVGDEVKIHKRNDRIYLRIRDNNTFYLTQINPNTGEPLSTLTLNIPNITLYPSGFMTWDNTDYIILRAYFNATNYQMILTNNNALKADTLSFTPRNLTIADITSELTPTDATITPSTLSVVKTPVSCDTLAINAYGELVQDTG